MAAEDGPDQTVERVCLRTWLPHTNIALIGGPDGVLRMERCALWAAMAAVSCCRRHVLSGGEAHVFHLVSTTTAFDSSMLRTGVSRSCAI